MKLTSDILLYFLHDLPSDVIRLPNDMEYIHGVKYLVPDADCFLHGFLYVCDFEGFMACRDSLPSDIVTAIVSESLSEADYRSGSVCGLVHIRTACSVMEVLNLLLESYYKLTEWDKNMHIAALEGQSIQQMLDLSEEIMEYPMILFDAGFNVLAHTKRVPKADRAFRETLEHGYTDPEIMDRLKGKKFFSKIKQDDLLVAPAADSDGTNIYLQYFHNGALLGYSSIFLDHITPTKGYLDLVRLFMETMSLCMRRDYEDKRYGKMMYETFFQTLMSEGKVPEHQIREQTKILGNLPYEGRYALAVLEFVDQGDVPILFLGRMLENQFLHTQPFLNEGSIFLLKRLRENAPLQPFFDEAEMAKLHELLGKYRYLMGVSNLFYEIISMRDAGLQARAALALGKRAAHREIIFYYMDYYYFHMFSVLEQQMDVRLLRSDFL